MNGTQDRSWGQPDQGDAMGSMPGMDFSNLLDIGDFGDIDLPQFPPLDQDNSGNGHVVQQPPNTPYNAGIQGGHSAHDFATENFQMPMDIGQEMQAQVNSQRGSNTDLQDYARNAGQSMWDGQSQNGTPQMMQEPVYRQMHRIPPTPNSYELHGGDPARYMAQQQMDENTRVYLQQAYQMKKGEFTPLVSPAVTPQDSHFQTVPEFTIPGAYFSPLTSPALQAQNVGPDGRRPISRQTQPSTAGSSAATSPAAGTYDVEMVGAESTSLPETARRSRRKVQTPRSAGPAARIRQSPIVKPQKRKSVTMSTAISSKELEGLLREPQRAHPLSAATLTDSSGNESISPEPLSEALMSPPPKPGSTLQSPVIQGQIQPPTSAPATKSGSAAPATPASLMSIDSTKQGQPPQMIHMNNSTQSLPPPSSDSAGMEDFALPPSAAPTRQPAQITPNLSAETTPRLAARKTPKLGPLSTATGSSTQPGSATASPSITAIVSPDSALTPTSGRPLEGKSKHGKNRGSISTGSMVSPALRPKISPSIKPLLPDGATLNDSQHALLLASKSNYTHLLEGTLLPGVSYPESLSSGLTSKRTSHKIAEQGRRNRINEALKEMQALLPASAARPSPLVNGGNEEVSDCPHDNAKGGSTCASEAKEAKAANSKAATVESAIDYIRALQRQQYEIQKVFKAKDEEIAALRRQLSHAGLGATHDEQSSASSNAGSTS